MRALRGYLGWVAALLTAATIGGEARAQDGAWDIVLNGRSVHINAAHRWNEDNWGIGIEREFNGDGRWGQGRVGERFQG